MNSIEKIYSVSGLNREAGKLLESSFGTISLEGEVSNITFHSSGHIYFTLKDEFAALDAVMFRSSAERLSFRPERGTKLLVRASLSIYARTGRYQLIVRSMKEKGAGSLEEKFLKLKEKLKKEGLFDQENKKQIPAYPRLVGIITSPTGAAIRDILNVMNRRFAGIRVLIYPARVQGEGAAEELSKGLRALNTHYPDMDLIIVGRGGGSLEDLWPFNEEELARAIAASSIPVISAVGHETDVTISDFVADLRAPTPSAAAELVTREKQEVKSEVIKLYSQILSSVLNTLKIYSSRLERESSTAIFKTPLI
ncbi:MAG: exodeoxyribonuclease VII large subunit, partial [Elusimicrobia bacterium]|nr:exodeoxyribonuclease VII large subunit [Elusimicrobiota bacterium]